MKILMLARKTLNTSPGGDTVQINSTAKYLRLLGVQVDVKIAGEVIDYNNYDLMHFFNIIRPDDILPHILKSSLPFAVSTIFVDYSEYEKNRGGKIGLLANLIDGDLLEYIKAVGRLIKNGDKINSFRYLVSGHRASIRFIAKRASALLPNSHNEYKRFVNKYNVTRPYFKIPNAIDKEVFVGSVIGDPKFKDHVLCVGRIEGRKNQLNLIKALFDTDMQLTIIGKPSPNHMSYYNECVSLVNKNKNMQIIEHVNHNDLATMMSAAKVHVLPSWFETTGLSTLEAAIMNCNVVVTSKGDTTEYFGDLAYYCQPDDIESIKRAVLKAFNAPFRKELKDLINNEYVWQQTAEKTLHAYKSILENTK